MVVIGHYLPYGCPTYWRFLHDTIYKFHMPLFLIISGYLYANSSKDKNFSLVFIKKKFDRLMVPFTVIAIVAYVLKYIAGFFFILKHPVNLKSILNIFITSKNSYFPLLWFIYSLFAIFIIFPIMKRFLRLKYLIFIISFLLTLIPWFRDFYLIHIFLSLPFFVLELFF